jgi:prepilin-type N-terminal cleavage/methylation domain-containing protein/prepilin-type processing-associated H-X9-DG protein
MSKQRRGFTLIELLVVTAVIAILIALLIPAIAQCREAARRAMCKNNVAQLALALQNYEMAFGMLPPGTTNATGPIINQPSAEASHISWTVRILPYIELKNVFHRFDFNAGVYDSRNLVPQQSRVESFLCPSDGALPQVAQGRFATNYAGVHSSKVTPIDVNNDGLLFLNSSVRYAEIFDGASYTALVGEKTRPVEVWGWASGTRDTLRNSGKLPGGMIYSGVASGGSLDRTTERLLDKIAAETGSETPPQLLLPGGFTSAHAGGFHVGMADGSVQFLSGVMPPSLCGRNDGEMEFAF